MSLLRYAAASCGCVPAGTAAAAPVFLRLNVQVVKPSAVPRCGAASETPRVCGPEPSSERTPTV